MQRLGAAKHGRQRLDRRADDVVVRALLGEADARGLAMRAQRQAHLVLRRERFDQPRPQRIAQHEIEPAWRRERQQQRVVDREVDRLEACREVDLEQEALAETGNIILNACLATIANVLRRTMRMSLPSVVRGDGATLFDIRSSHPNNLVLFLYIDFIIKQRDIHGFIALLMDLPSITALKEIVRDFISGIDKQSGYVG